ncbi:unnamed protein product [Meganyctiphanes norvegica]|uniref:Uncharacterized protein n=1 Tax=Meganyctiphanes norvegica TaxID=48144 RepID=A0AAV2RQ02_MEGNR
MILQSEHHTMLNALLHTIHLNILHSAHRPTSASTTSQLPLRGAHLQKKKACTMLITHEGVQLHRKKGAYLHYHLELIDLGSIFLLIKMIAAKTVLGHISKEVLLQLTVITSH